MWIHYECGGCGSVLKIKESLAGTNGKCPACKKQFTVPQREPASQAEQETVADLVIEKNAPVPAETVKTAIVPVAGAPPSSAPQETKAEDFDLDAFLMEEVEPQSRPSRAANPAPPAPAAPPPKSGEITDASPPRSGSSAELPAVGDTHPAINASTTARDLLTKSMENGRVRVSSRQHLEQKKQAAKFDFSGAMAQLRRAALYLAAGIVVALGIYWLADRMFSNRLDLPPLAYVSGTVTLDGRPLPNVVVHLTSDKSSEGKSTDGKKINLRDATGMTNSSGFYEVQYIAGVPGAPLGNARVWLEPLSPEDFKRIPPSYLTIGSTDIRDVKDSGNESRFNIELKTAN